MSLKTVMKPHMKNSTVMIENGPRYVWPLSDDEDVEGAAVDWIVAIFVLSCLYFESPASIVNYQFIKAIAPPFRQTRRDSE